MLLYRAHALADRPGRHPAYHNNDPAQRARHRWFTSDLAAAIAHRAKIDGPSEIVMVEVDDAQAHDYRVATTPTTRCGLNPGDHSREPATDHFLPMFHVMRAEPVAIAGTDRIRDVIDVKARHPRAPIAVLDPPTGADLQIPLPLAA